jgi:hypothetical protein
MFAQKARASDADQLFVSAKTGCGIPVRHPAMHDALIIAALNPAIRSIGYVGKAEIGSRTVGVDAVVITREEGFFHLDVVPARAVLDSSTRRLVEAALEQLVLPPFTMTAADLASQPRLGNALECWRHRFVQVQISTRIKILQVLEDFGPMSFSRLLESVSSARDPAPAVLSLACANLLEIDLISQPLGPWSTVKCRARAE